MNRTIPILFMAFWLLSFGNSLLREKHEYRGDQVNCTYETNHGRIDGDYVSFYKNGQKKAEGRFENNYRIGKWTVWDSTGRMRIQRMYENPFVYQRIIPALPDGKLIALLSFPKYTLEYNSDGFIQYFGVKERMVVWEKRSWRFLPVKDNEALFQDDLLFRTLQENIQNHTITAYDEGDDEDFTKEVFPLVFDTSNFQIVGYKIKEVNFFDNERLLKETRILAICPVSINKNTLDTVGLYWAYFPEARKPLSEAKIQPNGNASKIKTLDDLFFYRDFNSFIYRYLDGKTRKYVELGMGQQNEKASEDQEIYLIECEHDLWMDFTK